jgi:hypothetical protein
MDSFVARTLPWVVVFLLLVTTILMGIWISFLQRRNDLLSDTLMQVVLTNSEERLSLTLKHTDEREKLRTECMLQLDSTLRSITASFTQLLAERLSALLAKSRTGSGGG